MPRNNIPNIARSKDALRSRGRFITYWHPVYKKWVCRAWPRTNGGSTPGRVQNSADFSTGIQAIKQNDHKNVTAARILAENSPYLPRDLLLKAAFGKLIWAIDQSGTIWQGIRFVYPEIQSALDSITQNPGDILYRGADGWYGLSIGEALQVLTVNEETGLPDWEDSQGGGGGGSGVTTMGMPSSFNPTIGASLADGYFFGRTIVATENINPSAVVLAIQSPSATVRVQPAIYAFDFTTGTWGALLRSGPIVTGVSKGIVSLALDAPLALTRNTGYLFGFTMDTDNFDLCSTPEDEAVQYMLATPGSLPDPASGVVDTNRQWGTIWLEV